MFLFLPLYLNQSLSEAAHRLMHAVAFEETILHLTPSGSDVWRSKGGIKSARTRCLSLLCGHDGSRLGLCDKVGNAG
jgi:hypothetical protein